MDKKQAFVNGLRDGLPIGLGYFAVAFSLGIIAKKAGIGPVAGFLASVLTTASAGEYGVFSQMVLHASYIEVALITLIANARYMLMSCALSQKFDEKTPFIHRFLVGFYITDEIFGVTISRPGKLVPQYTYGAIVASVPLWGLGTSLGIIAGSILPARVVSALSVALYGMFIAIIIPPAKKERAVLVAVIASFILSRLSGMIPVIRDLSGGTRTIILTVLIASVAAVIRPVKDEAEDDAEEANTGVKEIKTNDKEATE